MTRDIRTISVKKRRNIMPTKSKAPISKSLSNREIKDALSEIDNRLLVLEDSVLMYQRQVRELSEDIDKLERGEHRSTSKRKRFDTYHFVGNDGAIEETVDARSGEDNFRFSIGNYFKTEEEAEEYVEALIIAQSLRDLAEELDELEPRRSCRYGICYDTQTNSLATVTFSSRYSPPSQEIRCNSQEFLERALRRMGKDNLMKIMK